MLNLTLLVLLFFCAGLLAIVYFRAAPSTNRLRDRLPNRPGFDGIFLTLILAGVTWYLVSIVPGGPILKTYRFIIALLVFESIFLLALRWIRSTIIALLPSLLLAGLGLAGSLSNPENGLLMNTLVIVASLGAATLLVRMNFLRSSFFAMVAVLWTIYDVLLAYVLIPRVFVPSQEPQTFSIFPSIMVGELSVGNGDILFLVLFTLITLRDFGVKFAVLVAGLEAAALFATGMLLPENADPFPFLLVMTPIFFGVAGFAWLRRRQVRLSAQ